MYPPIEQDFKVPYRYRLYFTQGLFDVGNPLFRDTVWAHEGPVKLLFVVDNGVATAHPSLIADIEAYCGSFSEQLICTDCLIVDGGEQCKNDMGYVEAVLRAIDKNAIDRHSYVVVLGGGAVIDMVGYAAAIAHRGVRLVRVPTTVLSQNDSAVGVKNSVNAFGKKNFLGCFAPPHAVINDSLFLTTLDQRDWIAGIAEALKVALIKDAGFFEALEKDVQDLKARDSQAMDQLIYKCAAMHMEHIAQGGDPFERGSSRPLDFGHWAAHKLEYMTGYSLRHGEAVAKGIALDVTYSMECGFIDQATWERILSVFGHLGFDLRIPVTGRQERETLLAGIEEFREHLGGQLTITLIKGIGKKYDVHEIDYGTMARAIDVLNEYDMEKIG